MSAFDMPPLDPSGRSSRKASKGVSPILLLAMEFMYGFRMGKHPRRIVRPAT